MKKWKILREIFNYLQFSVFISLSFQNGQKNSSLFFLINYGNYSGCLHYASGVEKTKLLCSDLWNVTVYSQSQRKNVCSLK